MILHVVPGLDVPGNGIAVAAKLLAESQRQSGHVVDLSDTSVFVASSSTLQRYSRIYVHSMWLPSTIRACRKVLKAGVPLVRMTHANLDPLRLRYHGWKKWLASPVERWLLRRSEKIVATCEAERQWILAFEPRVKVVEVVDLKPFFKLDTDGHSPSVRTRQHADLHVLYLGRLHPLKGVRFLQQAVAELNASFSTSTSYLHLRTVSDHFGEQLERDWEWCDVLCLPTLSENFGLVVAEGLERGKIVITTDGAPAWGGGEKVKVRGEGEGGGVREVEKVGGGGERGGEKVEKVGGGGERGGEKVRLIYIRGFREGTERERVEGLKRALQGLL